jgi:hypothetical protein
MTKARVETIYEDITGEHTTLLAKSENFIPPTKNPDDCICGGGKSGATGRTLIANCPCCDGVQVLVVGICPCGGKHPIMKVYLPPDTNFRVRYIDSGEPKA